MRSTHAVEGPLVSAVCVKEGSFDSEETSYLSFLCAQDDTRIVFTLHNKKRGP
jgi:hypothetical protein